MIRLKLERFGMSYLDQPRHPLQTLPGLVVVGAFHVVLIYTLVHALDSSRTERLPPPTVAHLLPDITPPPPPPPMVDIQPQVTPTIVVPKVEVQPQAPPPLPHAPTATSATAAAPNAVAHTAPAAPADHSFSAGQIVGGARAPAYPDAYADAVRAGRVVVDCMIETTGVPTGCRVVSSAGGAGFAAETLRWLTGPDHPVYRPGVRDGVKLRGEHQWVVTFQPPE
jgi:hypothetical protein